MHLTNSEHQPNDGYVVASDFSEAAGAPANMIETMPEMRADSVEIVEEWLVENSDAIRDNGGTGDIQNLLDLLGASWKNNK